ncbi:hypothetical protein BJV77DRAFT_206734 [Russula vinacea]|nr:hypothetical protein BJV77DRAFT_206734 [Russula vinacea]
MASRGTAFAVIVVPGPALAPELGCIFGFIPDIGFRSLRPKFPPRYLTVETTWTSVTCSASSKGRVVTSSQFCPTSESFWDATQRPFPSSFPRRSPCLASPWDVTRCRHPSAHRSGRRERDTMSLFPSPCRGHVAHRCRTRRHVVSLHTSFWDVTRCRRPSAPHSRRLRRDTTLLIPSPHRGDYVGTWVFTI